MSAIIKLISWNMAGKAANWQAVFDSDVDAALLQEAYAPPDSLKNHFIIDWKKVWTDSDLRWQAVATSLAGSEKIDFRPIKNQPLGGRDPDALMVSRPGSLTAAVIKIKETGEEITIVSMYANWAYPIRQTGSRWLFADASVHRLISDLSGLIGSQNKHKIIAAGDLNILYGYGEYRSPYWGKHYSTCIPGKCYDVTI